MSDIIGIGLKEAAVALADTLEYELAANKLGITASELRSRIERLEEKLCLHIFTPKLERLALTEEGRVLIRIFRSALQERSKRSAG